MNKTLTSTPENNTVLNFINPNKLYNPKPFAYSHIAEVRNFERILHISGQGGENQQGLLSENFTTHRLCCTNLALDAYLVISFQNE